MPPPEPGGPELAGLPATLTGTGIGLTGPGAHDAARALLVATLTAAGADDPDLGGHVIATRTTLTRLLGPDTAHRAAILPRLITADTFDAVLTYAAHDLDTRRLLIDAEDAPDLDTYRADFDNQPIPPAVLLTEPPNSNPSDPGPPDPGPPDPGRTDRLAATARAGHLL